MLSLRSISRVPSSIGMPRGLSPESAPLGTAVTTAAPSAPQDITKSSRRRLVVGKRSAPLWSQDESGVRGRLAVESVLGDLDERTRIVSTDTAPWKYVCALSIDSPAGRFVGTGWVVAPRTLITAGHCVLDRTQMGGWANAIEVSPGRDRELTPFSTHRVVKFSTVDRWEQDQDPDFDIAAIHLDQDIFGAGEGFQVGAFPDAELLDFMVNVSGYPGSPGGGIEQWWAKNRIRAVTPRRIYYDVDTSGGQSGGPAYIFRDENGPPIVVGVHAYGVGGTPASVPMRVNSAPRMIPEVVDQIQAWIDNGPENS